MTTSRQPEGQSPPQAKPFQDDIEYLEHELAWIETRARKIYVTRGLKAVAGAPEDGSYQPIKAEPEVIRTRHEELVTQEQHLRDEIDARLAATWAARTRLGLDQLQEAHHLNEFERQVLLLAIAPVLQPAIEDVWSGACRVAHLTVGSIFTLLELDLRQRVEHREYFSPERVLVGAGLIELGGGPDPDPEELAEAVVRITSKAFNIMLGHSEANTTTDGDEADAPAPDQSRTREESQRRVVHHEDDAEEPRMSVPEVRLADLVLSPTTMELVEELVAAAQGRRRLLADWGVGGIADYGHGLVALFHGAPGTGKTFAAEAIAGHLGKPLYQAAMSDLLSRWVGDSEKNLAALFEAAEKDGAIVFLDEVDGLLAARGRGLQQHHDQMVNTLLKLLEQHDGLVIMATNIKGKLDSALSRRLAYQLEFEPPGPKERAALWRRMLPDSVPGSDSLDYDDLGRDFKLTGATIRNASMKAAFRAARRGAPLSHSLVAQAASEEVVAQNEGTSTGRPVTGFGQ